MVDPGTSTLPEANEDFFGVNLLQDLKDNIVSKRKMAIVGLPGSGKTRLALELARTLRHTNGYSAFWIRAQDEENFEQSFREIGSALELSEPKDQKEIKRQLEDTRPWVMVVDNLDGDRTLFGPRKFAELLPTCIDRNTIIFTSRDKRVLRDLVPANGIIHLAGLEPDDAKNLLHLKSQDDNARPEDITKLAAALSYSPLAIKQAASHIAKENLTIKDYLDLYEGSADAGSRLFAQANGCSTGELPAMKVWQLSLENLEATDELAVKFLQIMSMFSTKNIPESLLPRNSDASEFLRSVRALQALSFIERLAQGTTYDIHPLIQMAVRSHLRSTGKYENLYFLAIQRMCEKFPESFATERDFKCASLLISHAQELLREDDSKEILATKESTATLATRVSSFLGEQGSNQTAIHYARLAVDLTKEAMGTRDPQALKAMNDLAVSLRRAGKFEEAESTARTALEDRSVELGSTHLDTLASMNNLANVLYSRGKYGEAEVLHRQTAALKEETLGKDHPDTWKTLDNLSVTLEKLGKLEEAESICRSVLEQRVQQLGAEDLSTLTSKSNLGTILQLQHRWEEAWELHTAALVGRVAILGQTHPETINSRANLAAIQQCQREYDAAELLTKQVLDLRTAVLGKHHPDTIKALRNMANLQHSMQRWREAERMYREAFWLARGALGDEHPDTLTAKRKADELRDWLRRHPEADSARSNSSTDDVD